MLEDPGAALQESGTNPATTRAANDQQSHPNTSESIPTTNWKKTPTSGGSIQRLRVAATASCDHNHSRLHQWRPSCALGGGSNNVDVCQHGFGAVIGRKMNLQKGGDKGPDLCGAFSSELGNNSNSPVDSRLELGKDTNPSDSEGREFKDTRIRTSTNASRQCSFGTLPDLQLCSQALHLTTGASKTSDKRRAESPAIFLAFFHHSPSATMRINPKQKVIQPNIASWPV